MDSDAKFDALKFLFEEFLCKIIRGAGNYESMISHVNLLYTPWSQTHGIELLIQISKFIIKNKFT